MSQNSHASTSGDKFVVDSPINKDSQKIYDFEKSQHIDDMKIKQQKKREDGIMMNENICHFCGSKIVPPRKGFRSSSSGNVICDNCVRIMYQGLQERNKAEGKNKKIKRGRMTPKEIKKELDKSIIGQDEAKTTMAIAVYNHYKRIDIQSEIKLSKSNVLLMGPTGSGKTLIAKTIADLLDVPFAIADCTTLTEAGYVGDDVENVLLKLLQAADNDIEKAEKGIIFLDEIDKLAKSHVGPSVTKDPSGEGVQQALLKLIEGTVSNVPMTGGRKNPNEKCIQINTENILFICGGAFPGIESIINKRTSTKNTSIGFGANVEKEKEKSVTEALKQVTTEDLIEYGFIPEFIGRIPVIVSLDELDEDAMVKILTEPKDCIINQYKEFFKYDGVELEFSDEALKEIAAETIKRKTGARGLRGIIEGVLKEYMFMIPDEHDVYKCIVEKGGKVNVMRRQDEKQAC